ncbi:MAG: hypothetical protein IKT08_06350 [Bacteroidales bacterium]|nr:hypothetical protein [Bacteroidales bacterium]
MKLNNRILVLAVALIMGLTTVKAQTIQVLLTPKVRALPATVTSYLDDPFHYFTVQFIVNGSGSEGLDVFFDMDFTLDTKPFYVRTQPSSPPLMPIHLSEGVNLMKPEELHTQVWKRTETNVDYDRPLDALQLPEGTYTMCLDFYLWSSLPERVPVPTTGPCPSFEICYSGSAPELVAPMAGAQMALNGAMVVTPSRKVNFFWTPVISNCAGRRTRFNYMLKVVKVLEGQHYQDAIKFNPTVFSAEVPNNNFVVFDTLRDIKVRMERGALYAAQVHAEVISTTNSDPFIIANDGDSQPMLFFWDFPEDIDGFSRNYRFTVDDEDLQGETSHGVAGLTQWEGGVMEVSELEAILNKIKLQYLAGFIQDAAAVANLTRVYPNERGYVPTPKRRYVESDGYYTVPMTDDFEVSFMPSRHPSMKNASYSIELYNYADGGIENTTINEPLFREEIGEVPEKYNNMDSHEVISRTLAGWGANLEQGKLYYLQLSSQFSVEYWKYVVSDTIYYVNEQIAEHVHDTISRVFTETPLAYSNGVFFQWGDNPKVPNFTTPQWVVPVDRTKDDIYDPANIELPASVPEVKKSKSFPVSWTPVKDVAKGDKVEYEVNVYEVKKGQTLEEAVSRNKVLASRTVTDVNEISELNSGFFKVFSPQKTYVMTLSTRVNSESNTYHFENGNEALPIVFKIVK